MREPPQCTGVIGNTKIPKQCSTKACLRAYFGVAPPTCTSAESSIESLQCISAEASYTRLSVEEVRLAHYEATGQTTRPNKIGDGLEGQGAVPLAYPDFWPHATFSKLRNSHESSPFASGGITFRVGTDNSRDFLVHENIIAPRSEFVRLALKGVWQEARERIIPLPEDSIDAFDLYQQWLYTGNIYESRFRGTTTGYILLVGAYFIGEKFIDADYKDTIIDCIIHKLKTSRSFDKGQATLVWESTPVDSPLRKLRLDIYAWCGAPDWLDDDPDNDYYVNVEFAIALSRLQMEMGKNAKQHHAPFKVDSCKYHKHAKGDCYRAKELRYCA